MKSRSDVDKSMGMMFGLAIGDALGRPTEFMSLKNIHSKYGPDGIQDLPEQALYTDDTQMTIAIAEAHNGQLVPGTTLPYIMHVSYVAMEITAALSVEQVNNPDLAVQCALLHDTIEDTDVTYDDVKERFGTDVADGVMALSKDMTIAVSESKLKRKSLQLEDSVRRIKLQPMEVWMVKLADRITNLQPPPSHWNDDKIENYRKGAEVIYKELEVASAYLGDRLRVKIDRYGDV